MPVTFLPNAALIRGYGPPGRHTVPVTKSTGRHSTKPISRASAKASHTECPVIPIPYPSRVIMPLPIQPPMPSARIPHLLSRTD